MRVVAGLPGIAQTRHIYSAHITQPGIAGDFHCQRPPGLIPCRTLSGLLTPLGADVGYARALLCKLVLVRPLDASPWGGQAGDLHSVFSSASALGEGWREAARGCLRQGFDTAWGTLGVSAFGHAEHPMRTGTAGCKLGVQSGGAGGGGVRGGAVRGGQSPAGLISRLQLIPPLLLPLGAFLLQPKREVGEAGALRHQAGRSPAEGTVGAGKGLVGKGAVQVVHQVQGLHPVHVRAAYRRDAVVTWEEDGGPRRAAYRVRVAATFLHCRSGRRGSGGGTR